MLSILYIGLASGTSLDRANAYRRLGHHITHLDTRQLLPHGQWVDHVTWKIGDQWFANHLRSRLSHWIKGKYFDLCHVDTSEWINARTVRLLKEHCTKVLNYNIDDPTGFRDRKRFTCYSDAAPEYDLLAVVRKENLPEVRALGAKNAILLTRSADELTHAPRRITDDDLRKWSSDVLFLGTWMPERGRFLYELIKCGVPLTIRGARWHKAPQWKLLRPYWKGGHLEGDDYARAIQCAKVNIGLVSEGNRDQHTTRSAEIPALGRLLCAKRTEDHMSMYIEGREAVFWSTAEECASVCASILNNADFRKKVANAGHVRCMTSKYLNESTCERLLTEARRG